MAEPSFSAHPFLLAVEDVARELETDVDKGLTAGEAQQRQQRYGRNELHVQEPTPWYSILVKQFCNAMVLVLFVVLGVSFGIGDNIEGGVVAGVIVVNVSIGFYQEFRAEKKMDALRTLSSPSATVVRDGHAHVVPNAEVVPGDVVLLRTGDTVPADVRLMECVNLACDEQMLTGESVPVDKVAHNRIRDPATGQPATDAARVTDGDRINLAFASTSVSAGRGRGLVVATGMATAVGRIAAASSSKSRRKPGRSMNARKHGARRAAAGGARRAGDLVLRLVGLQDVTPLQRRLTYLSYLLFALAVGIALVVFAVHRFALDSEVVLYAASTAIALIPESLPVVLVMTMVQATRVMRRAHVVVRDLAALELLGSVTHICSDKTGTLTQGAMVVQKAWLPSQAAALTLRQDGDRGGSNTNDPTAGRVVWEAADEEKKSGQTGSAIEPTPALRTFLMACALCNAATVRRDDNDNDAAAAATGTWQAIGEPTEVALQVFAMRFGLGKRALEAAGWTQRAEFPFDSDLKRMSVLYEGPPPAEAGSSEDGGTPREGMAMILAKGAVERILERCTTVRTGTQGTEDDVPLTDAHRARILAQMDALAPLGLRVLALAARPWPLRGGDGASPAPLPTRDAAERALTFLGLVGIYDPPRAETAGAVRACAEAGIRVHMLTGDHPATAAAIAREVGILGAAETTETTETTDLVMPAPVLDAKTDAELDALPRLPAVVARCTPATKTRMMEALRRRGARSAMTGDGVNDAPSLRRADVGIAMGSGSDVAKDAAALVLADDRFCSIVAGVREGRRMFDNIQKFVLHLLVSNVAEVLLLVVGLAFRDADGRSVFPASALHILWINLVTSALPALGLGREPASPDVLRRPPPRGRLFTPQLVADMLVYGVVMGAASLLTFVAVVYGAHGGRLGRDCNRAWSEACRPVFRARAAVFVQLTYLILLCAWECKDLRRSLFRLRPASARAHAFPANVAVDLWDNKLLCLAVLAGLVPPVVLVYVPVVGEKVLRHQPITWEWGLVVAGIAVFLLAVEAWKYAKRALHLFEEPVSWDDAPADAGCPSLAPKSRKSSTGSMV